MLKASSISEMNARGSLVSDSVWLGYPSSDEDQG